MRIFSGLAVLLAATALAPAAAAEGVLDRIAKTGEIRLAYRDDAAPFSFVAEGKTEPQGYSVELCRAVARSVQAELKLDALKISYVLVDPEYRFQAISNGEAELLCEATTETLERREAFDFSIPTFISGAGLMIAPGGPTSFEALAGKKVGVLGGTTTEQDLMAYLNTRGIAAEITFQNWFQPAQRVEQAGFRGRHGDFGNLGDFVEGQALKHSQNNDFAFGVGQIVDGIADFSFRFAVLHAVGRFGCAGIDGIDDGAGVGLEC